MKARRFIKRPDREYSKRDYILLVVIKYKLDYFEEEVFIGGDILYCRGTSPGKIWFPLDENYAWLKHAKMKEPLFVSLEFIPNTGKDRHIRPIIITKGQVEIYDETGPEYLTIKVKDLEDKDFNFIKKKNAKHSKILVRPGVYSQNCGGTIFDK